MPLPDPPKDDVLPAFALAMLAIILVLFAVHNLPWHLDDLDQAKQAYTSHQMLGEGKWLYQETPTGRVATKPPLQSWLSAGVFLAGGGKGWEFAWRLPAFIAALLILVHLWRTGGALYGNNVGAVLAAGAFGLNLYVPRLATLVRTDMLLTAFIFFAGWLILEKLRAETEWTARDRVFLGLITLGSMLTKGPIAFGFLMPGLLAYFVLSRRFRLKGNAWPGWTVWLLPLAIFGVWLWYGCQMSPDFKEQVIDKEFLGRFTVGKEARHNNQLPGYYTLNLLGRTLPWTLLLVAMFMQRNVRAALRENSALLWLTCWTFGGLIFMECVPSKRFDRILPVVPPACLLLAAAARYLPGHALGKLQVVHIAILAPLLAIPMGAGYSGWEVYKGFRDGGGGLVEFGSKVQDFVGERTGKLAVVNGKDEGMVIYTGMLRFTKLEDALALWKGKQIDWMVLGDNDFDKNETKLQPFEVLTQAPHLPEKYSGYRLLHRIVPTNPTP